MTNQEVKAWLDWFVQNFNAVMVTFKEAYEAQE